MPRNARKALVQGWNKGRWAAGALAMTVLLPVVLKRNLLSMASNVLEAPNSRHQCKLALTKLAILTR